MSEANGHIVIEVAELTIKQLDDIQRLVRQYKWGPITAMTYVYMKATDPQITRAQVEAMRSGDVDIIKDPGDAKLPDPDDAIFQPSESGADVWDQPGRIA